MTPFKFLGHWWKWGLCQSCRQAFYLMIVMDRFMRGRWLERFNLNNCKHCYMIGCDNRENWLDYKRSYQK